MHRYRMGQTFRPPTAAESAAHADALEGFRRRPPVSQDLAPVGQTIIVKTPADGIDARDDTTISSAVCTRCIEIDAADSTKTLVETDEELRIYNIHPAAVAGDSFVSTALLSDGTRYVERDDEVHFGKLGATLTYNDATGVTVTIWTGKPAAVTSPARTVDNVVISELLMTSGELANGSAVRIQRIDGKWFVVGAPC